MAHANPQNAPKKGCLYRILKWVLIALLAFVLFVVGMVACSDTEDSDQNGAAGDTTTSAPEAEPEAPAEEVGPSNPQDALTAAIKDELGDDVTVEFVEGKDVRVNIPITSAWSESSAAKSVRYDTIEVIRLVKESEHEGGTPYLRVSANADMVDQMGNSSNREVIMASYWPETLDQINPDGVRQENVWEIADERFIHPAFQD